MKNPWIGTQLYAGPKERLTFSVSEMRSAILGAKETADIDGLMIWPSEDFPLAETLTRTARACGIETYLWFPVLADVPGLSARNDDLVQCFDGARGNGRTAVWESLEGGDENFLFICPNNDRALDRIFVAYASLLDRLEVDGVMLDRIRYPSPANGFESLLSCFCPSCRARFEEEEGHPLESLAARASSFILRMKELTGEAFSAEWKETDSLLKVVGLADLAGFRERSILKAVRRFALHARSKGLKVGLDVFSPSLSGLVSQDYAGLSECCDWIKPMIYCHAVGPAGLPLEVASLGKALHSLCPRVGKVGAMDILRQVFRWDMPATEEQLLSEGLSEQIVFSELAKIREWNIRAETGIFVGIEAVRNPYFRINITEEILERCLSRLAEPAAGVIASWNLLYIPRENLKVIGALKG